MTAEIAILNKSAVALATDSAVTISSGHSNTKVFDSADKLIELSCSQPIGVMIYNGMQFAGIPLPDLIKEFRAGIGSKEFKTVEEAAISLLTFLSELGKCSPAEVTARTVLPIAIPIIKVFDQKIEDAVRRKLSESEEFPNDLDTFIKDVTERLLKVFENLAARSSDAIFLDAIQALNLTELESDLIDATMREVLPGIDQSTFDRLGAAVKRYVISGDLSNSKTGIVVAGFGRDERFPTLVSYEIEGIVAGHLKYKPTDKCDIDRRGKRAFIKPFAQKDMVDRFLYGLDDAIQSDLIRFCRESVSTISSEILNCLDIDDATALEDLKSRISIAESNFVKSLKDIGFATIEGKSRKAIEDMIEFMPKPELAKMAEALVELTSMKRKVSAGMETVGGPVDVAVISKSEGFVWIRRKHYFSPDVNSRYLVRART